MGIAKQKIGIFSPYVNILGGGEKYILSIAEYFSNFNSVTIFWNNKDIASEVKQKLNIDISNTKIKSIPTNFISFYKELLSYDKFFYMTDGSLFFSPAKRNYLIIQSPVHIPNNSWINRIKLRNYIILTYSEFINKIVCNKLHKKTTIIAPPVDTNLFLKLKKEKIILSVGRFFPWLHSKKQEVLIDAFKWLFHNKEAKNYKLILVGSVDRGADDYFNNIKKSVMSLPIEIKQNIDFKELVKIYGKSQLYWHAAGFNENINDNPEKAEHFGISIVEAMAAGCVPLVYDAGGPHEIVDDGVNGYLWKSFDKLIAKTLELIQTQGKLDSLSSQAIIKSKSYSKTSFINQINKL